MTRPPLDYQRFGAPLHHGFRKLILKGGLEIDPNSWLYVDLLSESECILSIDRSSFASSDPTLLAPLPGLSAGCSTNDNWS